MKKHVVISARLFPPAVIAKARNMLGRDEWIHSIRIARDRATVTLGSTDGPSQDQLLLFKAALTAAAIRHFSRRPFRALHNRGMVDGGPFQLSLDLFGQRVRVSLNAGQSTWPSVLRALSRLRLAAPVVDSTDPVDRVVLELHLLEGTAVEEAIRELVGVLRAELTGPAA